MNKKSTFGILGLLLVGVIVFLVVKFMWWLLIGGIILLLVFIVMLFLSSKKSTADEGDGMHDLEDQVRQALSKIRQQKFKSEAKINRLKEWANDAIETTYGDLFGDSVLKTELYKNYKDIKIEYADKLTAAQVEKTDQIVNNCLKNLSLEKSKIETLDKLQVEHETLKQKLKNVKLEERKNQRLDKHVKRISNVEDDLSGEATIAKADYTLDDLKSEVALKQEYVKQLEEVSLLYGDNLENIDSLDNSKTSDYQNKLDELKNKL